MGWYLATLLILYNLIIMHQFQSIRDLILELKRELENKK